MRRTRGAFLEGLCGGPGGAKPAASEPALPGPEVEQLLGQPDCVAQFGAVRAAHEAIAAHGETPEWLGVLVRGYANLALLTQHYWNAAPEVFTARSWLYAQRLAAATGLSEQVLWHRAYAWAWGGALPLALADCEELERRQQLATSAEEKERVASAVPTWGKLIKPYCQCDRPVIRQVIDADPATKSWGVLLRFGLASFCHQDRWMAQTHERLSRLARQLTWCSAD